MQEKEKQTKEEKEWKSYEEGWAEGYEDGITDFSEVERQKELLRKKGFPVIG
jgi:hypothetical protein